MRFLGASARKNARSASAISFSQAYPGEIQPARRTHSPPGTQRETASLPFKMKAMAMADAIIRA